MCLHFAGSCCCHTAASSSDDLVIRGSLQQQLRVAPGVLAAVQKCQQLLCAPPAPLTDSLMLHACLPRCCNTHAVARSDVRACIAFPAWMHNYLAALHPRLAGVGGFDLVKLARCLADLGYKPGRPFLTDLAAAVEVGCD